MKILFVSHFYYFFGGAETVLINEIKFLKKLGIEVALYGVMDNKNLNPDFPSFFLEKDSVGKKIENGLPLNTLDKLTFILNNINNNNSGKSFESFLKIQKPDIVHVHKYSRYITPKIYEVAKRYNIPVISTQHDAKLACPVSFLLQANNGYCKDKLCINGNYFHSLKFKCKNSSFFETFIDTLELFLNKNNYLKNTTKMIVSSLYLKNILEKAGISSKKIFFIPNFVNLELFKYIDKVGNYFLYYGRLSKEKGLLTLLKAFEDLPFLTLKIVGNGSQENELKNYVKEQNIKNIEFLGRKDGNDLVKIIQYSKATILPSECGEAFGLSIIESFACGKPVIGSNLGGISELISESIDGYLFESGNIEDLKQKVLLITNKNNTELLEMGQKGREKVEKNYTLEKHCKSLIELYKNVLN